MSQFGLGDHVALKRDLTVYGLVQLTHTDSNAPFGIDAWTGHVDVPPEVLEEFFATGMPPEGYVYVEFVHDRIGCCLVNENDLVLVSRAFGLGDIVKQEGSSLMGTVINVSETYILEPVFPRNSSTRPPTCSETCPSTMPEHFQHPNPHILLYNIPAREIKRAQDVLSGDSIIYGNWLGRVEDVEYDTVVMLTDSSVVVIVGSFGLNMPAPVSSKPFITVPQLNCLWQPDVLGAIQGWPNTIPVEHPQRGDFVIVDREYLRVGKWLSGSYNPSTPLEGIVLDCRAHDVIVEWVSTSTQGSDPPDATRMPRQEITIYEDIRTFRDFPDVRLKKDVILYDTGRMPIKPVEQRAISGEAGSAHNQASCHDAHNSGDGYSGQELEVGMHVKFRDPSAAAMKYQGIGGISHGKLLRATEHASRSWDLNEYTIVFMQQSATVMWQDGSVTTADSISLTHFPNIDDEILPTNIVLRREGMQQRPIQQNGKVIGPAKVFDEMTFFEGPHDLLPTGAGVVQSVDPREKIARVRWFKEPKLELRGPEQTLAPGSRFGAIGDEVEDVSLIEIYPCFSRQRGDICVLAPPGPFKISQNELSKSSLSDPATVASMFSQTPDPSANASLRWRPSWASPKASTTREQGKRAGRFDWIGQILSLGLDGLITVRLGASQPCRDVLLDADSIIAVLASRHYWGDDDTTFSLMDLDSWGDSDFLYTAENRPISETIEYEGGERLDNDSGDENWVSDDDQVFEDAQEELHDQDGGLDLSEASERPGNAATSQRPLFELEKVPGSEPPAQFLVLDQQPPSDQFGLYTSAAAPGLKRILKEHQILVTSLPEGEIYVRTYESRIDLLRCLIIGPRDTPYEHAPFLVDLCLPANFPEAPPSAHFHSWTSGLGRINPNLYEEGKVCLSLLGTWSAKRESEKWSNKATLLQVLVSLQGLVFVKRPFYNEAGFEKYEYSGAYTSESDSYSEQAFVMSRGFLKSALLRPPGGLEDILAWLYLPHDISNPSNSLLGTVIERGKLLMQRSEEARANHDDSLVDSAGAKDDETKVFLKPLSRGASVMLRRVIGELQTQFDRFLAESAKLTSDDDDEKIDDS
ncbi:hypothetical protein CLAIMM_10065 [Cladophialophora immunda]|nr:hypothetical protein CLAIMM_10065 [Cladophialophora immunda]